MPDQLVNEKAASLKSISRERVEIREVYNPDDALIKDLFAIELSAHTDPWSFDAIKDCFTQYNHVLVVLVHGRPVGFAVVQLIGPDAELHTIGIMRSMQGQGLGRRLLTAVLDLCRSRQVQTCFLEVREHNEPAKKLYLSSGFVICGLRRNYYPACNGVPAENALTMLNRLQ